MASPILIAAVKRDFETGGLALVLGTEQRTLLVAYWVIVVLRWLLSFTPQDSGFFRTRRSCELLALLLREREGIRLSPETMRRGMRRMEFVWSRPRLVVGPREPGHDTKLGQIQRLIPRLPSDETVVFQDEVDVHLDPNIGSCWMVRVEQAEVVTPGNNEKRLLAGSLHSRTGRLLLSAPTRRRNAALFVAHLDHLRRQLRGYRVIHVVCDNARFNDCRAVRDFLARHSGRIVLHYLPKYAPETNPVERLWWHLQETITRNHRCRTIDALLNQVYEWAHTQSNVNRQTLSFRTT